MQFLALSSFIAGILTVLTPCVLPLLPIILGKSISSNNKWRPVVIIVSLMFSITLFTILLKSISTFASVPPSVWTTVSGVLVVGMGIITLFPKLWQVVTRTTKIEEKSQKLLEEGGSR